ncbi:MAG TPA: hypothetical protein V6C71_25985 [Coleofasciculaceae cyanobacterium]
MTGRRSHFFNSLHTAFVAVRSHFQSISLKHHSTIPSELGARGQKAIALSIH